MRSPRYGSMRSPRYDGPEPHAARALRMHERQQPLPLRDDLVPPGPAERAEELHDQAVVGRLPHPGEEAVDEEGAVRLVAPPAAAPQLRRYDPGAVGVGEQQ